MKLAVVIVQMQSEWDRVETSVVLGESSASLNVAIILINNAEWKSYKGKSDYATLLPPISAY